MSYGKILTGILDCEYADLQILEGVEYAWEDVREELEEIGLELNLNNIMFAVFSLGKKEMADWLDDKYEELDNEITEIMGDITILEDIISNLEDEIENDEEDNIDKLDELEDRKAELETLNTRLEELSEERDAIERMSPFEDIESFHNYLDTSVYIIDSKREDYEKYCKEILDIFEENTGFSLL